MSSSAQPVVPRQGDVVTVKVRYRPRGYLFYYFFLHVFSTHLANPLEGMLVRLPMLEDTALLMRFLCSAAGIGRPWVSMACLHASHPCAAASQSSAILHTTFHICMTTTCYVAQSHVQAAVLLRKRVWFLATSRPSGHTGVPEHRQLPHCLRRVKSPRGGLQGYHPPAGAY